MEPEPSYLVGVGGQKYGLGEAEAGAEGEGEGEG